jgi:ParB/RepB/Spo0J family partition protein
MNMAKKPRKRTIEHRPTASLKPHPMQATIFGDLSEVELQDLADDIEKNGLKMPPEVLPDGTIVCGHQRVRAFQLLGRETIPCWVNEDLAKQGAAAIEARLIEDNLHRRQLSKLAIARCYLALKEAALENGDDREDAKEDLRDHLAERFKMSGKQLERYVKMLDAPIPVQLAFEGGELSQKEVLAVVELDSDRQQQIAEQIEGGEVPKEVVKPHVQRQRNSEVGVETAVFRLARALETAERQQIADRLDELKGRHLVPQLSKLLKGARYVTNLHRLLKQRI